jgi:hypothetical protein
MARQAIVDRPDDGCTAEICGVVLLTKMYIVVLNCIPLYQ